MHQLKIASLLALFTTSSLFAAVDLTIVEGASSHKPSDGVPPPTGAKLLEKAKQNGMQKLNGDFVQVSAWKETLKCEPVYEGSQECFTGEARVSASFVLKTQFHETWEVTTTRGEHWHRVQENDSDHDAMQMAFEKARVDAQFYCNGNVLPAVNEVRTTRGNVMEWQCMFSEYRGTFQCKK